MRTIADLHIHSYYSRATSKELDLEHLNYWGQLKGLQVVATGDISHPKWLQEMTEKLEPSLPGLYRLKKPYRSSLPNDLPRACAGRVEFILSGEISCIYKKNDQVRKSHHVVFFPSLASVALFQDRLERIGNIRSDGRPILGLDSRDLLEIVLECDDNAHLIPAHIWTPWFSLLGSKSGFDTVQECFEDLSPYIFAVETGLSSDPPMNWRLSMLDNYHLVSNSDAHSPQKLAREANIFEGKIDYFQLFQALKDRHSETFWGTIEFFPQEGKYHYDGHRKCQKRMHPRETLANNGLCPVCGKPAVLGVEYRVEELADRPEGFHPKEAKSFLSLVPLTEILSEVHNVGAASKKVQRHYFSMLQELGPELEILLDHSLSEIEKVAGALVAEGVHRVREGEIEPEPGYDGEYGVIRLFKGDERQDIVNQGVLFQMEPQQKRPEPEPIIQTYAAATTVSSPESQPEPVVQEQDTFEYGSNQAQFQAIRHRGVPLVIQAGPGTGKTRTLTLRLADLIRNDHIDPKKILAITFTHKAANEMAERLAKYLGKSIAKNINVLTFHAFGLQILREWEGNFIKRSPDFRVVDPKSDARFLEILGKNAGRRVQHSMLDHISGVKSQLYTTETIPHERIVDLPDDFLPIWKHYEQLLKDWNAVDFDDLIGIPVHLLRNDPEQRRVWLQSYQVVAVDEFQDINRAQYEFFRLFALAARDVCVIGDPNQAIYGFRGADRSFFMQFQNDFNDAVRLQLRQNYRSEQNILSASSQVLDIGENEAVWSSVNSELKLAIHNAPTDRAEAEFIVHQIERLVGGTSHYSLDTRRVEGDEKCKFSFSDFAILLRSRSLLPPLVEALTRSGIPFESIDDGRLSSQQTINKLIDGLRLMELDHYFPAHLLKSWLQDHPAIYNALLAMPHPSISGIPDRDIQKNIESKIIEMKKGNSDSLSEKIKAIASFLNLDETDSDKLKALLRLAAPYNGHTEEYIDTLMLGRQLDQWDPKANRVRVMTMHASKGLEFPVVFIPGLEKDLMPFQLGKKISDPEEECRLLYVSMTRAKSHLFLTHCQKRLLRGNRQEQQPSPFLEKISKSLLEELNLYKRARSVRDDQLDLF